jgi:Lrp/AsnC family leucine-responsive transcriptional regulator
LTCPGNEHDDLRIFLTTHNPGIDVSTDPQLDSVGWKILQVLQDDARLSFSELGRRVKLSSPAVAERVRRMEDHGLITGYRAMLDLSKLGYPILAFIHLKIIGEQHQRFAAAAHTLTGIIECHHVTGEDGYMIKVIVSSMAHLENAIAQLRQYGETTTSIVLSSPVKEKLIHGGASGQAGDPLSPASLVEGN